MGERKRRGLGEGERSKDWRGTQGLGLKGLGQEIGMRLGGALKGTCITAVGDLRPGHVSHNYKGCTASTPGI